MAEAVLIFAAAGFGLGWLPWAPGTFGAMLGVPLAWWLLGYPPRRQALIAVVLLAVALLLCYWASVWLGGGDPSQIVADEFLVFPIAVVGLIAARRPWMMAIAFLLFRLIDILKPLPIGYLETLESGWGLVLDDVMAAIYVWIVLSAGILLWNRYRRTRA